MVATSLTPWEEFKLYLEIANHIFVILGVLLAIILYAKKQFELSYEKLNDKYLNFLELQLQHPGLGTNTSDHEIALHAPGTPQKAAREIIFDYLLSLFERAYLFLGTGIDRHAPWKSSEWESWKNWIQEYKQNPNFMQYWDEIKDKSSYTEKFVKFFDAELKREGK